MGKGRPATRSVQWNGRPASVQWHCQWRCYFLRMATVSSAWLSLICARLVACFNFMKGCADARAHDCCIMTSHAPWKDWATLSHSTHRPVLSNDIRCWFSVKSVGRYWVRADELRGCFQRVLFFGSRFNVFKKLVIEGSLYCSCLYTMTHHYDSPL